MHMTQIARATAILVGAMQLGVSVVLPVPPAIEVHRLELNAGIVTQDRTVRADSAVFWMHWTAAVIDPVTRLPVAGCRGSGGFNYPTGHKVAVLTLPEWTGAPGCTMDSLPSGTPLQLSATYVWGDNQVSARSDVFTVE
jgi:hypothetical protein